MVGTGGELYQVEDDIGPPGPLSHTGLTLHLKIQFLLIKWRK